MTENSRFHPATAYTDVQFSETFSTVHLDGVDASTLNALVCTQSASPGRSCLVGTGIAWVQGRWYQNTAAATMTFTQNASGSVRIDRVVLRYTAATNNIVLAVVQGTGGAGVPALTQDIATVYEMPICYVTLANGYTEILNANITDQRANMASGCVTYVIDNGDAAITTGSKGYLQIPFDCKTLGWSIIADQSGTGFVVDIKSVSVSSWPATSLTTASICASDKPTLASGKVAARNTNASTWTSTVTEGDVWEYVVDTANTVTRAVVTVYVVRTN